MSKIIPDKYNIAELVESVKANHVQDMSQNALLMSTFGFLGEMFTTQLNMNIVTQSETSNEVFPIKAKFDRDILTHAIMANIQNLYATPAYMDIRIGISEKVLDQNITNGSNTFVIDKKTPFYIEDFEFHLDYDIIITRSKPYNYSQQGYVYIAQYDMSEENELSNIDTPYLSPPVKTNISGDDYILVYCRIRQVETSYQYKKITTDDSIENKTFEFEFESQLANFDLFVEEPDGTTLTLKPVFEGTPITDTSKNYCYYTHMDQSTIRVKFISTYYNPGLNAKITIRLYTTQGESGNFTYNNTFFVNPESDIYTYKNVSLYVIPITDSYYGSDCKSIDDLKREIPMKLLARESLTSDADLQNYFNVLDTDENRLKFVKQIQNQNKTKFYSYLLMKDDKNNVIPTNTLPLSLSNTVMLQNNDIIKPGTAFHYNALLSAAELTNDVPLNSNSQYSEFYYSTPFIIKINRSPILHASYYLNIIDIGYITNFTYINSLSFLQFICTNVYIKRKYTEDRNVYKLTTTITQNIDEDFDLVDVDSNGVITNNGLKAFYLFYDQYNNPVKYKMCDVISYDDSTKEYTLEAKLNTQDEFDKSGSFLNITNLNDLGAETESDTYLPRQTKVVLYVLYKGTTENGRDDADKYVPGLDGYTLSNKYTIDPGIELYINFSEITESVVTVSKTGNNPMQFHISSIPMIKYDYMNDEDNITNFIDKLIQRKLYIDDALTILEDPFGIDMKLFNTYGPSKVFTVGHDKITLNRTNVSLKFRMKLDIMAQDNLRELIITDIKSYIENLNNEVDLHYSNLDQYLRNKFSSIQWIEFLGINDYDVSKQYIMRDTTIEGVTPEFLNINTIDDMPDIQITIV